MIDPHQGGDYSAVYVRPLQPRCVDVTASNAKAPELGAFFQMSIPADGNGAAAPEGTERTYNIAAVDRALDLLEALARIGPATLAALAELDFLQFTLRGIESARIDLAKRLAL